MPVQEGQIKIITYDSENADTLVQDLNNSVTEEDFQTPGMKTIVRCKKGQISIIKLKK
jgi:hypothetical protein